MAARVGSLVRTSDGKRAIVLRLLGDQRAHVGFPDRPIPDKPVVDVDTAEDEPIRKADATIAEVLDAGTWNHAVSDGEHDDYARHCLEVFEQVKALHRDSAGRYWSEHDVKAALCAKLDAHPPFNLSACMKNGEGRGNGGLGTWVHAEVSWQDERGALYIRPDISIFHPTRSKMLETDGSQTAFINRFDKPSTSKMAQFDGPAVAIELKYASKRLETIRADVLDDYVKAFRIVYLHAFVHVFVVYASRLDEPDSIDLPDSRWVHPIHLRGALKPDR